MRVIQRFLEQRDRVPEVPLDGCLGGTECVGEISAFTVLHMHLQT